MIETIRGTSFQGRLAIRKDEDMTPVGKVNILLVDDQPKNLIVLEAILAGMGQNLVRARSGEEALLRILDDDYAVILMDVQMPGLDGFETAQLIRDRDRSRHTPIIFLTAFEPNDSQIFRGYALGAVDYLFKPIVPAILKSKVSVFVELFQKTEQVRYQGELLHENQRKEHERALAEEKRRWEVDHLRREAEKEKKIAEALAQKAEELARTVAERTSAEQQLRDRARQQAIVADLGQRALAGADLAALLDEAVKLAACNLEVEWCQILELMPDGTSLRQRAGVGWQDEPDGPAVVGVGSESLAGFTLLANEPVIVEDMGAEARFQVCPSMRDRGVVSAVSVLIHGRDRPFGTLGALSGRRRAFTQDDVNFLQAIANVLATATVRKRDEEDLASIRDELAVQLADMTRLHDLGARLPNSLDLQEVLEEVLSAVTGLQGTDRGVLMLYDREHDLMSTAASVGFTPGELDADEPESFGIRAKAAVTAMIGGGIRFDDVESDPVFAPHLSAARGAGVRTVCTTPLLTCGGELIGTIATDFALQHRPSERETRMVELYARQAAEFIDNARLYRQIQEADRHKDEFLAMLAHELRNPLAPLLNALHLLRLPDAEGPAIEQAQAVAERQVRHLARLVDDLLDVSRINNGKIQLRREPIDLRKAIARAVETARPSILARRQELTVSVPDEPLRLDADAARLEQVLSNLLNNAAKYTEPGGRIWFEAAREGEVAVIRVRDTGIGIAPELLPRVFDLFTQADRSLDRSQGGLGIGLTLVRRLVEMHGGSVSAASGGPGLGSEFAVRLPLDVSDPSVATRNGGTDSVPAAPGQVAPVRVLVVDDNVDGARMLSRLLQTSGHETFVAHDGPAALETARSHKPDVVLLDIGLPGMNGFEVAQRLRAIEGLDQVKLVALTGYGQEEDRRRSAEAGIDHHLVKPVDHDALKNLLADEAARLAQTPAGQLVPSSSN